MPFSHSFHYLHFFPVQSSINSDSPRISQTMNYCLSKNNPTFNHHPNFIIIFGDQRRGVKLWAFIICFEICTNIVRVWEESIMSFSYRNCISLPLHFYTCGFSDLLISQTSFICLGWFMFLSHYEFSLTIPALMVFIHL